MKMIFSCGWLAMFCAVVTMQSGHGVTAQFQDLQDCPLDCRFVPMLTNCFAKKFLDMFGLPPISADCPTTSSSSFPTPNTGGGYQRSTQAGQNLRSDYMDDLVRRRTLEKQRSGTRQHPVVTATAAVNAAAAFLVRQLGLSIADNVAPTSDAFISSTADRLPEFEPILREMLKPLAAQLSGFRSRLASMSRTRNVPDAYAEKEGKGERGDNRKDDWSTTLDDQPSNVEEFQRIVACLNSYSEADYEDGLQWLKCLFVCRDLPVLSTCLTNAFEEIPPCSRNLWLTDLILRLVTDFMEMQSCFFEIKSPAVYDGTRPVELVEGSNSTVIEFRTYLPPGVHCWPINVIADRRELIRGAISNIFKLNPPCNVEIAITTSNYVYDYLPYRPNLVNIGRPKCQDGRAINQVALGWHDQAVNSSGIISLTATNWNAQFSVPVMAVIDYKREENGFINTSFTLKFLVDGATVNTTKIPLRVYDKDPVNMSSCHSFNDPHIVTFDGTYYNNLYHGFFRLYAHSYLPYEVQVIYQACNSSTRQSCTCAAAVRSGDDVFVIDRCRRKCSGVSNCPTDYPTVQTVALYLNGELTPGTSIYKLDGGISYQVILPHGTMVKISTNQDLLNVFVTPSPYDIDSTMGLCGTFNERADDDMTLSNGTVVSVNDSRVFVESWRVAVNDTIFDGSLETNISFNAAANFCQCEHMLITGSRCRCGNDLLLETCDLNLENKFSPTNITMIWKKSKRLEGVSDDLENIDIDVEYIPPEVNFASNATWWWDIAISYCLAKIEDSRNLLIRSCRTGGIMNSKPLPPVTNAVTGCLDDIKITDSSMWMMSALESAKFGCFERIQRSLTISMSPYLDYTCANDCNDKGNCSNGKCVCSSQFKGPDCSLVVGEPPTIIMGDVSLCDVRYENCRYATIYGNNFVDDSSITCRVKPIKLLESDKLKSTTAVDVSVLLVSSNQVVCQLPSASGYFISVLYNQRVHHEIKFQAYDSVCYNCKQTNAECVLKETSAYCLVNGQCYANLQQHPSDDCNICNVTLSNEKLVYKTTEECLARKKAAEDKRAADKRDEDIRIGVSVGLSCLIVLLTIIMAIRSRQHEKAAAAAARQVEGENVRRGSIKPEDIGGNSSNNEEPTTSGSSSGSVSTTSDHQLPTELTMKKTTLFDATDGEISSPAIVVTAAENPGQDLDEAFNPPLESCQQYGTITSLSRVNYLKRDRANSETSIKSLGMGGGAPLQFGFNNTRRTSTAITAVVRL